MGGDGGGIGAAAGFFFKKKMCFLFCAVLREPRCFHSEVRVWPKENTGSVMATIMIQILFIYFVYAGVLL